MVNVCVPEHTESIGAGWGGGGAEGALPSRTGYSDVVYFLDMGMPFSL